MCLSFSAVMLASLFLEEGQTAALRSGMISPEPPELSSRSVLSEMEGQRSVRNAAMAHCHLVRQHQLPGRLLPSQSLCIPAFPGRPRPPWLGTAVFPAWNAPSPFRAWQIPAHLSGPHPEGSVWCEGLRQRPWASTSVSQTRTQSQAQ